MRFYLGTHKAHWLRLVDLPLFVSHRTLRDRKSMPRALGPWGLDSGGFSELKLHGEWRTTPDEYVEAVTRYMEEIGNIAFAAPQDWMCEPIMLERTGLTVDEHQKRTVENYLDLASREIGGIFIPVIQGWTLNDYIACIQLYADSGIDLTTFPTVGIGSVCRREATTEIAQILAEIASYGIRLHGFGVKKGGITTSAPYLVSSDSMAWSFGARYEPPLAGHPHKACNNCIAYALRWRSRIVRSNALIE